MEEEALQGKPAIAINKAYELTTTYTTFARPLDTLYGVRPCRELRVVASHVMNIPIQTSWSVRVS